MWIALHEHSFKCIQRKGNLAHPTFGAKIPKPSTHVDCLQLLKSHKEQDDYITDAV